MLGYAATKTRNLFDAQTYTEKRPEYALYVQDDFRATNKLTLNLGLRWDVFVPWVEVDDRQSNFDVTTGQVRGGLAGRGHGRHQGRPLPADVFEGGLRPALRLRLRPGRQRQTVLRGGVGVFWNFTPGGTSSSKAQNPPFLQSTALDLELPPDAQDLGRAPAAARRRSDRVRPPAAPAPSSTSTSATPTPRTST